MTNIGIQLFTYDQTRNAINLLRAVEAVCDDAHKLKVVWTEHDGTRRTSLLGKILSTKEAEINLNDCHLQSPAKHARTELGALNVLDMIVHLNISPNCSWWAHASEPTRTGRPAIRRVISRVVGLERSAEHRKPDIIPSALEITLTCLPTNVDNAIESVCTMVNSVWPRIDCVEKFGTIDFGGEWLFFPQLGYNPHVSQLFAFHVMEARAQWSKWRGTHNVSFEVPENGATEGRAHMIIHSTVERQSACANDSRMRH